MTRLHKIRISHTETHKLFIPLPKYCLTSPDINSILFVVVVLRKLAMPVAGGVPCVGSTFYACHRKKLLYGKKLSHLQATTSLLGNWSAENCFRIKRIASTRNQDTISLRFPLIPTYTYQSQT